AMSGSNTICTATVLLETGMLLMREPETRFVLEAPGGLVHVTARCREGRCEEIEFTNVPSFVVALEAPLEVAGLGTVRADIAYGGMFFAIVDARTLGFEVAPDEARDIVQAGLKITAAAAEQVRAVHPENPDIHTVSITAVAAPLEDVGPGRKRSRNACVVRPGRIDRCPTGTATSARLAVLHARGLIRVGDVFENRSIIDSRFLARVVATTTVGAYPAVVPAVAGRGWVIGVYQYGLDPTDPYPEGYRLEDLSGA
ncbi:MAG: proline racemase family protein, partial [Alphaproteobacteria bacterium]